METWTITKLLDWMTDYFCKNEVDSPRLCAELLLAHVLELERIQLYMFFDRIVEPSQLDILRTLVKRCAGHEPIAYLTGNKEFYSLPFQVSPACLIPRPETELLVDQALTFLSDREGPQQVLDIGTGSGCIAVAIAINNPNTTITAIDLSSEALQAATANVASHKLQDRIELLQGNLFAPVANKQFDLIVSNPPYIATSEYETLDQCVRDYEPKEALLAGAEGLDVYQQIASDIETHLKPDTALILEIGHLQGPSVRNLLNQSDLFADITIIRDVADKDRVVIARH